jgi:hypothetical protein
MLITLLGLLLVLVFTVLILPFFKTEYGCIYYKERYSLADKSIFATGVAAICIVLGGFLLLICLVMIPVAQIPKEADYQATLNEKEVLEYRLENQEDNVLENSILYNDIVEFNNKVIMHKVNSNNLWINWFYNKKLGQIDTIEVKEK